MSKGQQAKLTCSPDFAYGSQVRCPPSFVAGLAGIVPVEPDRGRPRLMPRMLRARALAALLLSVAEAGKQPSWTVVVACKLCLAFCSLHFVLYWFVRWPEPSHCHCIHFLVFAWELPCCLAASRACRVWAMGSSHPTPLSSSMWSSSALRKPWTPTSTPCLG